MEEQPQAQEEERRYKTLGVRLEEGLHAQLTFIAQLTGSTIGDEIKRSIEERVQAAQSDPELIARAQEVRAQIEREAEARKAAIASLFGGVAVSGEVPAVPRTARRSGRSGGGNEASSSSHDGA